MSAEVPSRPKSVEGVAAEFAESLTAVLKPAPVACPVEHFAAWARTILAPRPRAEKIALANALQTEVRRVLNERIGAGALDPPARAVALFTVLWLQLGRELPPAFLEGCEAGDLFKGAAAALNQLTDDALMSVVARAELVWILKAALAFRAAVEPHLTGHAREYLTAVEALEAGAPLPKFSFAPNTVTRFLAEVSDLGEQPTTTAPARPVAGRFLRFIGGDRFGLTRTGQLRLALVGGVGIVALVACGIYSAARSTIAEFNAENEWSKFERSLISDRR